VLYLAKGVVEIHAQVSGFSFAQPYRRIMEHGSARRGGGFGAGQAVDAKAADKGMIGPNTLDDQCPWIEPGGGAQMQGHLALVIADGNDVAIGQAQVFAGLGVDQQGRAFLGLLRRRCFRETAVEEIPRWSRHQPEGLFGGGGVHRLHVIGQGRHACMVGPQGRPIGGEMEAAILVGKAIEEMRGLKRRSAIQPTGIG